MSDVPELIVGPGSISRLGELFAVYGPRVLLVASSRGLARFGIDRILPTGSRTFSGFCPNPRLEDVLSGCEVAAGHQPDVIVGLGGGSSMDTAKLMRTLPPGDAGRHVVLSGASDLLRNDSPPLVLVPTVSGSGSEVTRFATVYSDGRKYSVDHERLLATASIIDINLAASCPRPFAFSAILDALAHAVESLWSLKSTHESRVLAREALILLQQIAVRGNSSMDVAARAQVAAAAIRAGRAIDITRTTAAHAFAYPTTVRFGVPHGLACGLHLIWMLDHACAQIQTSCVDPRGEQFVAARLGEIASFLDAGHPSESGKTLGSVLTRFGFSARLSSYGVTADDTPLLVEDALSYGRASNLPVMLSASAALSALNRRL